jgi:SAM-dependent methyltransferase
VRRSLRRWVRRPDPNRDWERFGHDEPYLGVITHDSFLRERLSPEVLAAFFATGEQHVAEVVSMIEGELDPGFAPKRALELGCGVGRILVPLAERCEEVVGVDVSESMLREARRNLDQRGIRNVTLVRAGDSLAGVAGRFDWVHSYIVLQHIPPPRGNRLLERLLDLLAENGIGVVHLTFDSELPRRSQLIEWARRSLPGANTLWNRRHRLPSDAPWMQMYRYDLNRVFLLLQDKGCHRCVVRFSNHVGHRGVVLFFRKTALPGW